MCDDDGDGLGEGGGERESVIVGGVEAGVVQGKEGGGGLFSDSQLPLQYTRTQQIGPNVRAEPGSAHLEY